MFNKLPQYNAAISYLSVYFNRIIIKDRYDILNFFIDCAAAG